MKDLTIYLNKMIITESDSLTSLSFYDLIK